MQSRSDNEELAAVWGSSGHDVYAVGSIVSPDFDSFFEPARGEVLHYDGSTWSQIVGNETLALVEYVGGIGIWGSSASDVYIVGPGIVHYDGKKWKAVKTPEQQEYPNFVRDAHLRYPTPRWAWAATLFLRLYKHFDDYSWIGRQLGPMAESAAAEIRGTDKCSFRAISGSSATDIYAVGDGYFPLRAPILHYGRDRKWRPIDSGQEKPLTSVICLPSGDVYATGSDNRGILHYDGKPCNEPPTAPGWRRLLFWRR